MAILKSFDPANYETKSITLAVSAGSSYTLGDAYTGGGRVVDIWGAEGFSSSVGAKGVDFVLSGIDKRLTSDYGTTYYTVFKSLTITGSVTITYRRYGTYVDAGQINQHEIRLGGHDSRLTAAEASNTAQDIRLTAIEQKNSDQDASITDISDDLSAETSARQSHESNTTDPHGAVSAATANKIAIRDENARLQVAAGAADSDVVNKAQMEAALEALSLAAGSGNVTTTDTSATDGEIVVERGTTGKAIGKSGRAIGNASGNVPLANGVKCVNLFAGSSGKNYWGSYSGQYTLTYVSDDMLVGSGNAVLKVQYGAGSIPDPNLPSNWEFDIHHIDHVSSSEGRITVIARPANGNTNLSSWIRKWESGTWATSWTQLTDDNGNAINANSLGGVAAAFYTGFIGNVGDTLQNGVMTNNTPVTVNAGCSGWVTINAWNSTENNIYFHIDGIQVAGAFAQFLVTSYPIKAGQTFSVTLQNFNHAAFAIKAALS